MWEIAFPSKLHCQPFDSILMVIVHHKLPGIPERRFANRSSNTPRAWVLTVYIYQGELPWFMAVHIAGNMLSGLGFCLLAVQCCTAAIFIFFYHPLTSNQGLLTFPPLPEIDRQELPLCIDNVKVLYSRVFLHAWCCLSEGLKENDLCHRAVMLVIRSLLPPFCPDFPPLISCYISMPMSSFHLAPVDHYNYAVLHLSPPLHVHCLQLNSGYRMLIST